MNRQATKIEYTANCYAGMLLECENMECDERAEAMDDILADLVIEYETAEEIMGEMMAMSCMTRYNAASGYYKTAAHTAIVAKLAEITE